MCIHYHQSFPDYPIRPELIPLHEVRTVETWKEIDYVTNTDEELAGIFTFHLDYNEVIILFPGKSDFFNDTLSWMVSVLAHEIFHYFQKSCCLEEFDKIEYLDASKLEAFAYWAQDEFLKRRYGTRLIEYILPDKISDRDKKELDSFTSMSEMLYSMAMAKYLYNAPLWVAKDPQKKYDKLIKGYYTINRFGF